MAKKLPDPDRPFSIASTPDRSFSKLGTYVRFKKKYQAKSRFTIKKGDLGIIARDVKGICKPLHVAIRVPGCRPKEYLSIPVEVLEPVRSQA